MPKTRKKGPLGQTRSAEAASKTDTSKAASKKTKQKSRQTQDTETLWNTDTEPTPATQGIGVLAPIVAANPNNEIGQNQRSGGWMNALKEFTSTGWIEDRGAWISYKDKVLRLLRLQGSYLDQQGKEDFLFIRGGPLIQEISRGEHAPNEDLSTDAEGNFTHAFDNLLKRCDAYFNISAQASITEIRLFREMKQQKGERFQNFLKRLRDAAPACGFGTRSDQEILIRILSGAAHREKLVQEHLTRQMTLAEVVHMANRLEADSGMNTDLDEETKKPDTSTGNAEASVDAVTNNSRNYNRFPRQSTDNRNQQYRYQPYPLPPTRTPYQYQGNAPHLPQRTEANTCSRCGGYKHTVNPCPAINKKCNNCGLIGHYSNSCRLSRGTNQNNYEGSTNSNRGYRQPFNATPPAQTDNKPGQGNIQAIQKVNTQRGWSDTDEES